MSGEKERRRELRELIRPINPSRETRGDRRLVLMLGKHTAGISQGKNGAVAALWVSAAA